MRILGETFRLVSFGDTRLVELPCVYLMAHKAGGQHCIHYAGQTHDLCERFAGHHMLVSAMAGGATHALVLVVPEGEARRRAMETVLRWHFQPPLNREEIPTHMQAWRAATWLGMADVAERAKAAHFARTAPMAPAWTRMPRVG